MNSSFVIFAVLVVGTLAIFLIVGMVLAIKLGRAKQKVWSGKSSLKSGNLAAAVTDFREAASISIGAKDFFKLWGGQRDSFDEALEGLATAYHQAGVAVNFTQLAELHQRHLRMSQREGAGLMKGSGDELAQVRQHGRSFIDRLPHLPAGARPKNVSPAPGMPPMNVASAAVAAPPQSVPMQGLPSQSLSEQLAPPHWTSPCGLKSAWPTTFRTGLVFAR